ncbi:hypothetical protein AAC387_Pa05g0551 [Persea americana]
MGNKIRARRREREDNDQTKAVVRGCCSLADSSGGASSEGGIIQLEEFFSGYLLGFAIMRWHYIKISVVRGGSRVERMASLKAQYLPLGHV